MRVPGFTFPLLGIMLVCFGGIYAFWLCGRSDIYFAVMHAYGVDAWTHPFLDLTGAVSMGECHRLGIDVLKSNPCDPLNRLLAYGPPLLYFPFVTAETDTLGAVQATIFLIVAAFVLRPRSRSELALVAAASLGSSVLYAVERGNLDMLEFALIALSGPLSARGRTGRFVSYTLYYAGGTLKFYPFTLLLMIVRERLMLALSLATVGTFMIGLYVGINWHTLKAIGPLLPPFEYDTDVFGAQCLPFGIADWLGLPELAGSALMALLVAGFGFVAWRLARVLQGESLKFDGLNFHYLLAGAIVLCGCFFSRPNITYRCIFLLLLLPGLLELRRISSLRRLCEVAIGITLFCLWSDFIRHWGDLGIDHIEDFVAPDRSDGLLWDAPYMLFFAFRELVWWWLIAFLSAMVTVFVLNSPAMREARELFPAARENVVGRV